MKGKFEGEGMSGKPADAYVDYSVFPGIQKPGSPLQSLGAAAERAEGLEIVLRIVESQAAELLRVVEELQEFGWREG